MENLVRFKDYIQKEIDEDDVYLINSETEQGYHVKLDFFQVIEPLFGDFINIENLNYSEFDLISVKDAIDFFIVEGLIEIKEELDCPIL